MVISPPTHIENHLLAYRPFLGFDGADVIADEVYTTCTLGMEKHLIDLFGDAGLDLPEKREGVAVAEPAPVAPPVESSKPLAEPPVAVAVTSAPAPSQTSPAAVTSAPAPVDPVWAADAEAMLKKVPFFVRGRVRGNVEKYARQRGHAVITAEVLLAAKEELGA